MTRNTRTSKDVMTSLISQQAGGLPNQLVPFAGRLGHHQVGGRPLEIPSLAQLPLMIQALKAPAKPVSEGTPLLTLMEIILDESGSMTTGCSQTMPSYNQALAVLKPSAEQIGCRIDQVSFNHAPRLIAEGVKAHEIVPLSPETYQPNGGTALYDTIAAVIWHVLQNPKAHDDNTSVLLNVTTDGDDMNSTVFGTASMEEFRSLMRAVSQNDRWTVALSGPDTKLRWFADLMCVHPDNVAAFTPEDVSSRVVAGNASVSAMRSYASVRGAGLKKSEMLYAGTQANVVAQSILSGDAG